VGVPYIMYLVSVKVTTIIWCNCDLTHNIGPTLALFLEKKILCHYPNNMAYAYMFYGDYQTSDNVWTFLRQFEEDLTELFKRL
jgi:hypothetical protein